jgi:hypothetical protein
MPRISTDGAGIQSGPAPRFVARYPWHQVYVRGSRHGPARRPIRGIDADVFSQALRGARGGRVLPQFSRRIQRFTALSRNRRLCKLFRINNVIIVLRQRNGYNMLATNITGIMNASARAEGSVVRDGIKR